MPSTTKKIKTTLVQFYSKPIAKVSLELFMSIGAVIFFAVFAIRPTLVTMSDLIKEIEDKRELNQQLSQKIAALSSAQSQYLQLQDRLYVLDQAIPLQPEIEQSLKIIEKIASEQQLVIRSVTMKEIPEDHDPSIPFGQLERISVPISISVQGDFMSIRTFIEEMKNNRRALIVESVTFNVDEERDKKELVATIITELQYFGQTGGTQK